MSLSIHIALHFIRCGLWVHNDSDKAGTTPEIDATGGRKINKSQGCVLNAAFVNLVAKDQTQETGKENNYKQRVASHSTFAVQILPPVESSPSHVLGQAAVFDEVFFQAA